MFTDINDIKKFLYRQTELKGDHNAQPFIRIIKEWNGDTFKTDGKSIYVSLKAANQWSKPEVYGVFLHEVWHILYEHTKRLKETNIDHDMMNYATDYIINNKLKQHGRSLPKGTITHDTFMKWGLDIPPSANTSRKVYNLLKEHQDNLKELFDQLKKEKEKEQQALDRQSNNNQSNQNNDESESNDSQGSNNKPNQPNSNQQDSSDNQSQSNKGDKTDKQVAQNAKPSDLNKSDKESQGSQNIKELSDEMIDAINKSNNIQSIEFEPNDYIGKQSKISYIDFIVNRVGRKLVQIRKPSYSRPSRRQHNYSSNEIHKGSAYSKPVPITNIYVDASGSMEQLPYKIFNDIYKSKFKLSQLKANFFEFDTEVREVQITNLKLKIGGGTNIDKVIKHINESKCEIAIVVTDGEDTFDDRQLRCFTIFVTDNKHLDIHSPNQKYYQNFGEL